MATGKKNSSPIKVMVVDDSAVIRGLFVNLLDSDPDIEIVATASTGIMAVNLLAASSAKKIDVDIITLDVQMPEMDGLTALPLLLERVPTAKIIMASTLTNDNAEETVKALSLGAADYLAKPERSEREAMYAFSRDLIEKVKVLGAIAREDRLRKAAEKKPEAAAVVKPELVKPKKPPRQINLRKRSLVEKPKAIAIGSSTGGPQALTQLFRQFKLNKFNVPIFLTQHMPPQFTAMLAKQISDVSDKQCAEGKEGEPVIPGRVYVAPGDTHMLVKKVGDNILINITRDPPENFCRPAVDPMLRSLVKVYGSKILVLILTGMGADGMLGCREVVAQGGAVIAQDEETSVVWGMPGAVAMDGLCVDVEPLPKLHETLIDLAQGQIQ